jgi:hypothetical protein
VGVGTCPLNLLLNVSLRAGKVVQQRGQLQVQASGPEREIWSGGEYGVCEQKEDIRIIPGVCVQSHSARGLKYLA